MYNTNYDYDHRISHIAAYHLAGRKQDVLALAQTQLPESDLSKFQELLEHDSDLNYKNTSFLLRSSQNSGIDLTLSVYLEYRKWAKRLRGLDVNKCKNAQDLLQKISDVKIQEAARHSSYPGTRVIFPTSSQPNRFLLIQIKSYEGMKQAGRGTEWCVTQFHHYENYKKEGTVFFVLFDLLNNRKYALEVEPGKSFNAWNERDHNRGSVEVINLIGQDKNAITDQGNTKLIQKILNVTKTSGKSIDTAIELNKKYQDKIKSQTLTIQDLEHINANYKGPGNAGFIELKDLPQEIIPYLLNYIKTHKDSMTYELLEALSTHVSDPDQVYELASFMLDKFQSYNIRYVGKMNEDDRIKYLIRVFDSPTNQSYESFKDDLEDVIEHADGPSLQQLLDHLSKKPDYTDYLFKFAQDHLRLRGAHAAPAVQKTVRRLLSTVDTVQPDIFPLLSPSDIRFIADQSSNALGFIFKFRLIDPSSISAATAHSIFSALLTVRRLTPFDLSYHLSSPIFVSPSGTAKFSVEQIVSDIINKHGMAFLVKSLESLYNLNKIPLLRSLLTYVVSTYGFKPLISDSLTFDHIYHSKSLTRPQDIAVSDIIQAHKRPPT